MSATMRRAEPQMQRTSGVLAHANAQSLVCNRLAEPRSLWSRQLRTAMCPDCTHSAFPETFSPKTR